MITADEWETAWARFNDAFFVLAQIEDQQAQIEMEIASYVEGSPLHTKATARRGDLKPAMAKAQREYKRAGMEIDRLRGLIDIEKIAAGA